MIICSDIKTREDEKGMSVKPKVLFYRPPDDVFGGRVYDYLFKPKDRILQQFFDVEFAHDQSSLIKHLRHDDYAMIILYILAECKKNAYSVKVINYLNSNPAAKLLLYNTDAHSAGNYYVEHIAKEINLTAVLSCEPVVEAYFKFSVPTFYWMWSVDPNAFVYENKTYDLFISSRNSNRPGYYSWRFENGRHISDKFPKSLSSTNDTWSVYQKKLASCRFSYTCGSSNNTIVQKHLEIPASGTCLITEETSLVRMMGFEDGVNCVVGSGALLMEKLDNLQISPDKVTSITDAGRRLVLERHTHAHRTQILELFNLIRANENLRNYYQPNPFDSIIRKDRTECLTPRWLEESPPRDLEAISEWINSDELDKPQRFDKLRYYLKEGHPKLLDAWANWVSNQPDLSLLRRTLFDLCLTVDGLPDQLIFNSSFAKIYSRILLESRIPLINKSICNIGLAYIGKGGSGGRSVAKRLFFIVVGMWLLDVITLRNVFYFSKLFVTSCLMRFRTVDRLFGKY
jgi:hypothetical protein